MGDPGGIGPEIALKAWAALKDAGPAFAIHADPAVMAAAAAMAGLPAPQAVGSHGEAAAVFARALPLIPAEAPDPARATIAAIESAVAAALSGQASGVVTCPISKSALYKAGFAHPGHTEFIAALTKAAPFEGARGPVMMLACPALKVTLATIHLPLKEAIASLAPDMVAHVARVTHEALKRDFGIARPRLALAGLNPHAGEGGTIGREEIDILAPALEALRAEGIAVSGPLPPDTMFHAEARAGYDAAVCLYHDQGLIPVKTLDFHGGVNVTLGLPIVRTSPDHGTAFDIAGRGVARPDSLVAAIRMAADMAAARRAA
jgi:4-hydroxythreonine-4-phosphate dehydrogenase